ncbi:hypothetical protein [Hydrogenophilus thiooxidans]|uniref:hypothetical protein n=1 Tax=Hydrogenophilus thiooxidans TaxID=2820326 RepID=UPI001C217630|nr:hypothetical protein [Hydrogenophilus thiooxidans]
MGLSVEALLAGSVESVAAAKVPANAPQQVHAMRHFERGVRLWGARSSGPTWRIERGIVALFQPDDRVTSAAERFVMLAYGGDLIGVEAQLFGTYAFDAVALTRTVLTSWSASPAIATHYLRHAERAHEGALLRSGSALARLQRLRRLLDRAAPGAPWPRLRDIAAITGLQVETVSRLLSRERGRIVASCS